MFDDLLALPCWPDGFDGGPRSLAALKNLTSELIGRLCGAAHQATMDASGGQPLTRYDGRPGGARGGSGWNARCSRGSPRTT